MIPFLLIAAVLYWLAAPDPVVAGARTAAGTGIRAAGAGVGQHWVAGRPGRELRRTDRRDRWSKNPGFWRNLLRVEHGAVITGKGVKGAAGITRAAVKPVPAAVKAGWVSGQERHRAKAGNRAVPVALDPPWWHREQPQEQPAEQVQVQDGNRPGDSAGTGAERTRLAQCVGCGHAEIRWVTRDPDGTLEPYCGRCGPEFFRPPGIAGLIHGLGHAPRALAPDAEAHLTEAVKLPRGTRDVLLADLPALVERHRGAPGPSDPWQDSPGPAPDWDTRTNIPADLRCQRCDEGRRRYTYNGVRVCAACAAELDRQGDVDPASLKTTPAPTDTTTDQPTNGAGMPSIETVASFEDHTRRLRDHHADMSDQIRQTGTWPTTTPTEGAPPVSVNMPSEINDLTTLHGFAQAVIDDAEENGPGSQYAAAAASISEFFGRDFGREVNATASAFEEAAAALNQAWTAMVEAAESMKNESLSAIGG